MTKIKFGTQDGTSTSDYRFSTHNESNTSIEVGALRDKAKRNVVILDHVGAVDPAVLAAELRALLQDKEIAKDTKTHAAIEAAHKAAIQGDVKSSLKKLQSVAKWTVDVATKIGVSVATAAIKNALGYSGT